MNFRSAALLLAALAFPAGVSAGFYGGGVTPGGDGFYIQPTDPTELDEIVLFYPQHACENERIEDRRHRGDINITIGFARACFFQGIGTPFRRYRIGRLKSGNYQIRLIYHDWSHGNAGRSFSVSETFAVMPAR